MEVVVVGNVALDVLCFPVEDVPRYDSISFEKSFVGPGGCGSNVAIGLAASGINVSLVARLGDDDAGRLLQGYWSQWGIDLNYLKICEDHATSISVGLVDKQFQPRFIHASGANSTLCIDDIDVLSYVRQGAKVICIAGFFVLPGLMDERLGVMLVQAQAMGLKTVLDVVNSPRMNHPETLWSILPGLDVLLCNSQEAARITQTQNYMDAATYLCDRGAKSVVVKLGAMGCYLKNESFQMHLPAEIVEQVVDTTGAGDAFAVGLVTSLFHNETLPSACQAGNHAGAQIVSELGTITAWGNPKYGP